MNIRKLSDKELRLLEFLVAHSDIAGMSGIMEWIGGCSCKSLSDGNMGSIELFNGATANVTTTTSQHFAYTAVEAEFKDKDGIPVVVALNVSDNGYPFEIDFWKVNFAPLLEYPAPEDMKILEKQGNVGTERQSPEAP